MNRKLLCAGLRWDFSVTGLVLLLYYGLMYLMVFLFGSLLQVDAAWGYLFAVILFTLLLLILPERRLLKLWKSEKLMNCIAFIHCFSFVLLSQWLFQLSTLVTVPLLSENAGKILSSATSSGDTLPMFIYVCLAAPVFEEILFRGIAQRRFCSYGKCFSILCSGILFGAFHANPIQAPFAFAFGLILGYISLEYSLGWAVVFHLLNNLVLGGIVNYIEPLWLGQLVHFFLVWGGGIFGLILLVKNNAAVASYFRDNGIKWVYFKAFITSPGIILLLAVLLANMILLMI